MQPPASRVRSTAIEALGAGVQIERHSSAVKVAQTQDGRCKSPSGPSIEDKEGDSPSAVPEIESQIAQKLHMAEIYINRSTQSSRVARNVVAEDDASHRAFARS